MPPPPPSRNVAQTRAVAELTHRAQCPPPPHAATGLWELPGAGMGGRGGHEWGGWGEAFVGSPVPIASPALRWERTWGSCWLPLGAGGSHIWMGHSAHLGGSTEPRGSLRGLVKREWEGGKGNLPLEQGRIRERGREGCGAQLLLAFIAVAESSHPGGAGGGWVQGCGEATPLHAITPPRVGTQPKHRSQGFSGIGDGSWDPHGAVGGGQPPTPYTGHVPPGPFGIAKVGPWGQRLLRHQGWKLFTVPVIVVPSEPLIPESSQQGEAGQGAASRADSWGRVRKWLLCMGTGAHATLSPAPMSRAQNPDPKCPEPKSPTPNVQTPHPPFSFWFTFPAPAKLTWR